MKITIDLDVEDKTIQKYFGKFVQTLADRLKKGEELYGKSTYKSMNLDKEMLEEFLDIVNYSFFKFILIKEVNKK